MLILHPRESTCLCSGESQGAGELPALCLDQQGFKHLWEVFLGASFLSVWEMFSSEGAHNCYCRRISAHECFYTRSVRKKRMVVLEMKSKNGLAVKVKDECGAGSVPYSPVICQEARGSSLY